MSVAVELRDVRKSYGAIDAISGLDLALRTGEVHAVLGPNGAGKTTAISIMTGLRRPDAGAVRVLDGDPREMRIRRRIGLTPQESGFPPNLRVGEILRLVRTHFEAPLADGELFRAFPLQPLLHRNAGGLSGGQQRILAAALAFAGDPELVFLDEPTTGLDVAARKSLWSAIRRHRERGTTVVLTTHYLEEAEALASRIAVLQSGQVLAAGTVDEIRTRVEQSRISYLGEIRKGLAGVAREERDGDNVILYAHDADAAVRALVEQRVPFARLQVRPATLEEAFVALTARGG